MLNKYGRILFAVVAFVMSFIWIYKGLYIPAVIMLIGVGFIVFGYFKHSTVYLAFKQLRAGKIEDARKTLNQIKNKDKLNKEHRAYFHFVWGYIYFAEQKHKEAIIEFEQALEGKIKTSHDQAMINVNLSSLYLKTGDKDSAIIKLAAAKEFKYKKSLNADIEALEAKFV